MTQGTMKPPEGYGVVGSGNCWMPIKWAPEAGEGAYRLLQTDRKDPMTDRVIAGEAHISPTYDAAVRWITYQLDADTPAPEPEPKTEAKPSRFKWAGKSKKKAKKAK